MRKYNVVMSAQPNHESPYGGFFGDSDWGSASGPAWEFYSLPKTGCCGFGYVKRPGCTNPMGLLEVEEFLRQAHFSGFMIECTNETYQFGVGHVDGHGQKMAAALSAKHAGMFTLHFFTLEPDKLQMYVAEIHDPAKFEEWKNS